MALIYTDVWEAIADRLPDHPAVVQGDRTITWAAYDDRAARLAAAFSAVGIGHDQKIGIYLYNSPEYMEAQFAAFKVRATPINVNYRYLEDELWYLLDDADCEAVIFHSSLGERLARVADRLPGVKLWIEVPDDDNHWDGAVRYDDILTQHDPVLTAIATQAGLPPFETAESVGDVAAAMVGGGLAQTSIPCCPLMHGTGMWLGGLITHLLGGTIVLLESRHLDVDEVWRLVERHGATSLVIVGDAFARPLLRALDDKAATGTPYDTSSLQTITSSGAMFSTEVKARLVRHVPLVSINDILGSTEGGMGQNVTEGDSESETAKFTLNPGVMVFDDNDEPVEPGSGVVGMVASTSSNVPLGYFKDPEKSARTFRTINGTRYTFHGDMATVEADGSITLLGRGSNCINTGGEKVFPEEVEEAVKTHEAVHDCLIFGAADERFGERVVGVASLEPGRTADTDEIIEHTKAHLSHFKAPRQLVLVAEVPRAANGKPDYATAKELSGLES